MVKQERIAWITVVFSLAVAIYYFWNVPLALDTQSLHSREMRRIVFMCFLLIMASEIAVAVVGKSESNLTDEDERDHRINDKAINVAYRTVLGFIVLLICQIVFFQGMSSFVGEEALREAPILGEGGVPGIVRN